MPPWALSFPLDSAPLPSYHRRMPKNPFGLSPQVLPLRALVVALAGIASLCHAAPVTAPYAENFASGSGSFTPAATTNTSWAPASGKYRANITVGNVPAAATVQAPAFENGFVIESTIKVVSSGSNENTFGLGFLGTEATLTGGATAGYYLADVKPGTNAIRLVKIATATEFLIDNEELSFALNTSADFKISVEGAYENTSLRITITVSQGTNFSQHVYEEEVPLAGTYFGLRCRTSSGSLTVDYDDFTLRGLTSVSFTTPPASFARSGVPYESAIAAQSDDGETATLTAEQLPPWLTFTDHANGTATLSGTPPVGISGTANVRLRISNPSGATWVQDFPISILGISGVIISEFLASNGGPFLDEDGDESDWIEILNADSSQVDLSGWMLKDDKASWTVPSGVVIPAYGTLVVFASDKNRGSATTPLHLNFKLSTNANSYIALARPNGSIVSEYTYPAQRQGVSYGAWGDYTSLGYLLTPTPGAGNAVQGFIGFAPDPSFSKPRGIFYAPQALTISSTLPGSSISYTLDGSLPTATHGTQVPATDSTTAPSVPLSVTNTSVIRAVSLKEGYAPSNAITHTYLFPDDIITQSSNGTPPPGWPAGPIKSQLLNYGMDPEIVTPNTAAVKAALVSLPSFSLVTDRDHLFSADTGIYVNAYGREEAWERPTSLEMIKPDGTSAFQINCGMRMRGGASRSAANPKHSFHFYFRGEYGSSHLEYPLFDNEGAQEFDRLDLRSTQGKSWHYSGGSEATYMRDEWARVIQGDMGHAHTRSRFAHLYINGQYWGIFATQERADDAFAASYFGGEKEDYDVIKSYVLPHRVEAADGDAIAWNELHAKATAGFASDAAYLAIQGLDSNGLPSATIKPLVEIDNLIDYMILNMYAGNTDGPVNPNANVPKNFYCFRPRDGSAGFRFVAHDFEDTLTGTNVTGNTAVGTTLAYFNPRWLHLQLAQNTNYRKRFADRVQKNLFNDGALSSTHSVARWNEMRAILQPAMIAESARWGDAKKEPPYNIANWAANCTSVENHLTNRANGLISQLRSTPVPPLFPSINAPVLSQHGGVIPSGFNLTITSPASTETYVTTNGSDPSGPGASLYQAPITLSGALVTVKTRAKHISTGEWSALTEAKFSLQPVPAAVGNLVISEVNYNPPPSLADPNDLSEFIELYNPSGSLVDLTGVKLFDAVGFTFPSMLLEPGQRIVVIKDTNSFEAIHGTGPRVAGIWTGSLNQTGEPVILLAANGTEIERVTYSSSLPWPPAASNNGRSLVRVRPELPANHPGSWRASMTDNGNPGGSDGVPLTGWLSSHGFADANSLSPGGLKALVHYATGIAEGASTQPEILITRNADHDLVTIRRSVAAIDNVRFQIDQSPDLGSWPGSTDVDNAGSNMTARVNNSDGTETVTIKIPTPTSPRFYRIRYTTR